MESKMYKVEYQHESGGTHSDYIVVRDGETLKDAIFHRIHRYRTGKDGGHGAAKAICTQVNRPSEQSLRKKIDFLIDKQQHLQELIDAALYEIRIPYVECKDTIEVKFDKLKDK